MDLSEQLARGNSLNDLLGELPIILDGVWSSDAHAIPLWVLAFKMFGSNFLLIETLCRTICDNVLP